MPSPRMLVAVDQAPRDADGERCGDPVIHACIAVDDLLAKLDELDPCEEAWAELRYWVKGAR